MALTHETRVRVPAAEFVCKAALNTEKTRVTVLRMISAGLWCSGITSALHAEGPGSEPRRLHMDLNKRKIYALQCVVPIFN